MPRRRYIFDPPERFVAGTVGEPGDRTFFLQAREGARIVSVALEKVQVAVLAERLGQLLGELERRGVDGAHEAVDVRLGDADDLGPLDEPLNEAFRAGSLTLGWDGGADRGPRRGARPGRGRRGDRSRRRRRRRRGRPGPAPRPHHASPTPARSSTGRPGSSHRGGRRARCAAHPLDPQGHICPRRNGHYVN